MCVHKLFIYTTCGHSTFSHEPLILCRHASIPPTQSHSSLCLLFAHPYHSWKLESLCPSCAKRRDSMLRRIDWCQQVEFDEYKWKVSYAMPAHGGKDYWTKKMEEKAAEEDKKERESRKVKDKKRFSWKRKSRRGGDG